MPRLALLAGLAILLSGGLARADSAPTAAQERALLQRVRAPRAADRLAAIKKLGQQRVAAAEVLLARVAVGDEQRSVREAARAALEDLPSQHEARRLFVTVLEKSDDAFELIHAAEAVEVFPVDEAVPALIALLQQTSGGFPRVHVAAARQGAYVADVEVDQTGVIPVLHPRLGKVTTGVVLEAKIILYYRETLVRALQKVTGQKLGDAPESWGRWWRAHGKKDARSAG